jgi:pimeloyl-ACP methyl ester carboxylesterase
VHGLTRRAEDFKHLAETISEVRDVYAFSMAGRGKSDWIDAAFYNYDQCVSDCRFLLQQLDLPQVDWLGTSMGGIIGMMIAGDKSRNNPIRRLVLNDVGPFISVEALHALAQHVTSYNGKPFKSQEDAEHYCVSAYRAYGTYGTPYWKELLDVTITHDAQRAILLHYDPHIVDALRNPAAFVAPYNLWHYYDSIDVPTLTLRGANFHMLPQETASEMTRYGPKSRITTFSGCGHAPALVFEEQIGAAAGFLAG